MNNTKTNTTDKRAIYARRYASGRSLILLTVIFTAVNIVLTMLNLSWNFLLKLALPYYAFIYGMLFTGHMPSDWYIDENGEEIYMHMPNGILIAAIAFTAIVLGAFILLWLLSKNVRGRCSRRRSCSAWTMRSR